MKKKAAKERQPMTTTTLQRLNHDSEKEVREACQSLGSLADVQEYFKDKYAPEDLEAYIKFHGWIKRKGGRRPMFDRDMIRTMRSAGKTPEQIQQELKCSPETVRRALLDFKGPVAKTEPVEGKRHFRFKPTKLEMRCLELLWSGAPEGRVKLITKITDKEFEDLRTKTGLRFLEDYPDQTFLNICKRQETVAEAAKRFKCFPSLVIERLNELQVQPETVFKELMEQIQEERSHVLNAVTEGLTPDEIDEVKNIVKGYSFETIQELEQHQVKERQNLLARHRVAIHYFSKWKAEEEHRKQRAYQIQQRRQALQAELEKLAQEEQELDR